MSIDNVILEMFGPDSRIVEIAAIFGAKPYGKTAEGQSDAGQASYYAALEIEVAAAEIAGSWAAQRTLRRLPALARYCSRIPSACALGLR